MQDKLIAGGAHAGQRAPCSSPSLSEQPTTLTSLTGWSSALPEGFPCSCWGPLWDYAWFQPLAISWRLASLLPPGRCSGPSATVWEGLTHGDSFGIFCFVLGLLLASELKRVNVGKVGQVKGRIQGSGRVLAKKGRPHGRPKKVAWDKPDSMISFCQSRF